MYRLLFVWCQNASPILGTELGRDATDVPDFRFSSNSASASTSTSSSLRIRTRFNVFPIHQAHPQSASSSPHTSLFYRFLLLHRSQWSTQAESNGGPLLPCSQAATRLLWPYMFLTTADTGRLVSSGRSLSKLFVCKIALHRQPYLRTKGTHLRHHAVSYCLCCLGIFTVRPLTMHACASADNTKCFEYTTTIQYFHVDYRD